MSYWVEQLAIKVLHRIRVFELPPGIVASSNLHRELTIIRLYAIILAVKFILFKKELINLNGVPALAVVSILSNIRRMHSI
jgi:hypothetical protein